MQFDHVAATGGLVQPVDVLRDDAADPPSCLEVREGLVSQAGTGVTEPLVTGDGR